MTVSTASLKQALPQYLLATISAFLSKTPTLMILFGGFFVMDATNFGRFTILMLLSNLVAVITSCGGDLWLNRFTKHNSKRFKNAPTVTRAYLKTSLGIGVVVGAAVLLIQLTSLEILKTPPILLVLALIYGIQTGWLETISAIIRSSNRISLFFVLRDFATSLLLVLGLVVTDLKTVKQFFFMANGLYLMIIFGLSIFLFANHKTYLPRTRKRNIPSTTLLLHTLNLTLNNLIARLANNFDVFLLAFILPVSVVGQYRLCSAIANGFIVVQHFAYLALPWQMQQSSAYLSDQQSTREVNNRQHLLALSGLLVIATLFFVMNFMSEMLHINSKMSIYRYMLLPLAMFRYCDVLWGPQHEILITNNKIHQEILIHGVMLVSGIILFGLCSLFATNLQAAMLSLGGANLIAQILKRWALRQQKSNVPLPNTLLPCALTLVTFLYVAVFL
ncbi:MAG: hypothetical protein ABFQ95_04060 [Pseudomonadota bacterium]